MFMNFCKIYFIFILNYSFVEAVDKRGLIDEIKGYAHCHNNETQDSNRFLQLKKSMRQLIEVLDPQEKRRANLRSRMKKAESKVKKYVAKKKKSVYPEISCYIPVYNRAKVVRTAIDSVYSQNLSVPFEVIVVDDASTDGTYKVLKEYEGRYDNFFVYRHKINKKAPAARNTAILHARGKYLFNLDSDDILLPGAIMKLYEGVKKYNLEHGFFGVYKYFNDFDASKIVLQSYVQVPTIFDIFAAVCNKTSMNQPTNIGCRLFSKKSWERVGGFLEEEGQDTWSFNYMVLASGLPGYVVPECGYLHRFWTNFQNYTVQHVMKNWDKSPLMALYFYSEILGKETLQYLKAKHTNGDFIFNYLKKGRICLLNRSAIEYLFKGIDQFEKKEYSAATDAFLQSIRKGCRHQKVYLKLLNAAFFARRFDDVLFAIKHL